ncbi:MAG: TraR/DksA family transcriptional regulator [Nocardioidaceae bacterium]
MTDLTVTQHEHGGPDTLRAPSAGRGDDLKALRTELEQQRSFRVRQLEELAATTRRDSAEAIEEATRQVALALTEAATAVLAEIDAALERIERGRYGRCGRCGTDIPLQRLQALPMASLCMPCQARQEPSAAARRDHPDLREQAALDLVEEWGAVPSLPATRPRTGR